MDKFGSGLMVGLLVGSCAVFYGLVALGATPLDMQQKLCSEAEWKLPSCAALIERAVDKAKGVKP